MSDILKLDFRGFSSLTTQRGVAVLGLALDGNRVDGVLLKRTNGSALPLKVFGASLSLDPLTNDPELVGRELRNILDAHGIKERRCVLGLPLKWALTTHVQVPELPEADVASFLQIEAERSFPCDVSTLLHASTMCALPSGKRFATLVGVPRNHVAQLERILQAAQLRPQSFTLGLVALQPPGAPGAEGLVALCIGETHVGLQVSCGGGLLALRALEGAFEAEGGQHKLRPEVVARDIRITLGQLPSEVRQVVRRVRVFGPRDLAQQLADEVELRLEPMGLEIELADSYSTADFAVHVPRESPVTPAFSLAARAVGSEAPLFEFLPPRVSTWQQFSARYSSGRLQRAGLAAAVVVVLLGGAFGWQQAQLWTLESRWRAMQKEVAELRDLQKKTAQFRPWNDESLRAMTILRRITESFPEDGAVTAKVLEIRDLGLVTCTGTARDYQALLKTVERLRTVPQIPDVNLGQTRGQSPALQFTLNFTWEEGGRHAN